MSFNTFLFWLQISFAFIFGVSQSAHMIFVSTSGLSVSMFLCTVTFFAINIALSLAIYKKYPEKELFRTLAVYTAYFLMYGVFLILLWIQSEGLWTRNDSITMILTTVSLGGSFTYARWKKISLIDPLVKGLYGFGFKTVPQLMLAWKIFQVGGAGLSVFMIVVVHTLTCVRLGQIFYTGVSLKRWDRNLIGLAVAETGNEASWILVTIAWFV